jgi:hypothetical protein
MKKSLPNKHKLQRYIKEGLARAGPSSRMQRNKKFILEARYGPP